MHIIEQLAEFTASFPIMRFLFDEAHSKGITYAKLDDMSGRIYAYLKQNKIGKKMFLKNKENSYSQSLNI